MKPRRFLITPVRNEAALLGAFLRHHAPLFEHIVIADQGSTDGSWEIACEHPKVIAIRNENPEYDEHARRVLLLDEVRRRCGDAFVVGLDADEFLLVEPGLWDSLCLDLRREHSGKTIQFSWNFLLPGGREWFVERHDFCRPFLDGDLPEKFIHAPRIPHGVSKHWCPDAPLLHLNLYWPRRQRMKAWWYSALESLRRFPIPVESRRLYLRSGLGLHRNRRPVPDSLKGAVRRVMDSIALADTWETWHRDEILRMLSGTGGSSLASAPIWDFPWDTEMAAAGLDCRVRQSRIGRILDWWASKTVARDKAIACRAVDAVLRRIF